MNVNFETRREENGTYTVTITFTDVPDEEQAAACDRVVRFALLPHGPHGIVGNNPFGDLARKK